MSPLLLWGRQDCLMPHSFSLAGKRNIPQGFCSGAADPRNGRRAIGVGLTLRSAIRLPRGSRAQRRRMNGLESNRKNYVALGKIACPTKPSVVKSPAEFDVDLSRVVEMESAEGQTVVE